MLVFSGPHSSRAKLGQQTYYAPYPFVGPAAGPVITSYPYFGPSAYPGYYPGALETVQVAQAAEPVPVAAPSAGLGIKDLLIPGAILGGILILSAVL